jgi:hypothetical protein
MDPEAPSPGVELKAPSLNIVAINADSYTKALWIREGKLNASCRSSRRVTDKEGTKHQR